MNNSFRKIAFALCFAVSISALSAKQLPDVALKQAQQAEQLLKKNQPLEAAKIFVAMDKEYPGTSAISLRLAQIYDGMDQRGAALFYYRRYANLMPDNPKEEALARLQTLEMLPGIPEVAADVAKKLGETTKPYGGPASQESRTLMGMKEDGSLVELKSAEDLSRIEKLKPVERKTESKAIELPGAEAFQEVQPGAAAKLEPAPATGASMAKEQSFAVSSGEPAPSQPTAVKPPKQAFDAVPSLGSKSGTAVEEFPRDQAELDRHKTVKMTVDEPGQSSRSSQEPVTQSFSEAPTVSRTHAPAVHSEPLGFFKSRRTEAKVAVLKVSNTVAGSMLTVAAVPKQGGTPVNMIVTGGEERTKEIEPGLYEVKISHQDGGYPPQTLVDKQFDFNFARNREYSRVFDAQPGL